ncbi:tRNA pseudouridine(55) synthase TruB [Patescibacteria group bacterium]|nr:tRNA pseudouridine(55) synthase TruB [Patescibacteria group bacterium]
MNNEKGKIFAAWKPKGPSSAQFLNSLKKKLGVRKIGHAGTLDPLASGILVVGVGKGTKKLGEAAGVEKEYIAKIKFGERSVTDDEEGKKTICEVKEIPKLDDVERAIGKFIGDIDQVPSDYSAAKVGGIHAYRLARRGKEIHLKPRAVKIFSIEIMKYAWPFLEIKVVTGTGVYVRALARDLGEALGVGGYIAELMRTRVGEFTKEDTADIS